MRTRRRSTFGWLSLLAALALLCLAGAPAALAEPTLCMGAVVTISGTAGNDTLTGTAGPDVIDAGDGNDVIDGLDGNDLLCGGAGDDVIHGGVGNDRLDGGGGNDSLFGEAGDDMLDGGAGGADTAQFVRAPGPVNANLASGTATGDGADTLANVERLIGSKYGDTLTGNAADNVFVGLAGNDTIDGGGGVDSVKYNFGAGPVTVNLAAHSASGEGADTLFNIEAVQGSEASDTLIGDGADNSLSGGGGNDFMQGGGGNDRLTGGAGNDQLDGGDGSDSADGGLGFDTCAAETLVNCELAAPPMVLIPADSGISPGLGSSVAISDDGQTIVAGSYYGNPEAHDGAAYVFLRSSAGWTQMAKLTPIDPGNADLFSWAVAISGDGQVIVVGAPADDDMGTGSGSVYVFERRDASWVQIAKLTADITAMAGFGTSVAISDDGQIIAVGAPRDDGPTNDSGSAYVFGRSAAAWLRLAKLTATDAATYDYFGYSVAISGAGQTIVVGAPGSDGLATDSGAAYAFNQVGIVWLQMAKLTVADATAGDNFGHSVAIDNDGRTTIIGAPGYAYAISHGSAYMFEQSGAGWLQTAMLAAPPRVDRVGVHVAVSGDGRTAIVGQMQSLVSIFQQSAGLWFQTTNLLVDDYACEPPIAVSGDGRTVVAGYKCGKSDLGVISGALYIYTLPAP